MLVHCPECDHPVSDQARSCPNCAFPISPSDDVLKSVGGGEPHEHAPTRFRPVSRPAQSWFWKTTKKVKRAPAIWASVVLLGVTAITGRQPIGCDPVRVESVAPDPIPTKGAYICTFKSLWKREVERRLVSADSPLPAGVPDEPPTDSLSQEEIVGRDQADRDQRRQLDSVAPEDGPDGQEILDTDRSKQ